MKIVMVMILLGGFSFLQANDSDELNLSKREAATYAKKYKPASSNMANHDCSKQAGVSINEYTIKRKRSGVAGPENSAQGAAGEAGTTE